MKACSPLSQPCMFSHLTHHPMLCVCVVPATINTALLLFGKPLGLTKPAPHPSLRTCALLSIFVHSFSSLSLSFSICLSYFLLSQSFSLTFSFLNLSLLLSPFSIFLCLSAQDCFTHNLIFNSTVQSPLLLSQYFSICILQRQRWGLRVPKCVRISYMSTCWKNIFYHKLYIVVIS